jgi:3-keto-5-aminohexanoate cleavage enzyme
LADIGQHQIDMNTVALVGGGDVRIAIEDDVWFNVERTHLAIDADLNKRILDTGKARGNAPCTSKEARAVLSG